MKDLILASKSPRRKQLLEQEGFKPSVIYTELSENIDKNLNIEQAIQTLAKEKCQAVLSLDQFLGKTDYIVLSADTIVLFQQNIFGKPQSFVEAQSMLTALSGKEHQVITAFCLYFSDKNSFITDCDKTSVWFKNLTDLEISDYIKTGEPMDKSGSYAIQGIGQKFVQKYEGSWTNVVGLPMEKIKPYLDPHKDKVGV